MLTNMLGPETMNQDELTDLGFTLAEIVRGIVRGNVGGHDKHVVDSMRHFLAGVAATQPSSDDCDLIASEAVRQMSIAPHAGGHRLMNPRKDSGTFI